MVILKKYVRNLLISLDQFANTVFGGDPDETISSRVGKAEHYSKLAGFLSRCLDILFGRGHADRSIELNEGSDELVHFPHDEDPK